jgi:DNA-binding NarL/FixJ family response regulator
MSDEKIRVLVMSKFRLTGAALCSHLRENDDKYEAQYAPCHQLSRFNGDFTPDVVIVTCMDQCVLRVPACASLFPGAKYLVVARMPEETKQVHWIRAGIHGIIDEAGDQADFGLLDRAISAIRGDVLWAPRKVLSLLLLHHAGADDSDPQPKLTKREKDLLGLLHLGLSNAEIASRLFISEKTVKGHLTRLYRKLNVENRAQATIKTTGFSPSTF